MTRPSSISTPLQPVVGGEDPAHGALDDADGTRHQFGALGLGEHPVGCEEDDVVAPLAHDLGVPDRVRRRADDAERLVADLVAVAVRAVQHVAGPAFTQPVDVGELVAQPGGERAPVGW